MVPPGNPVSPSALVRTKCPAGSFPPGLAQQWGNLYPRSVCVPEWFSHQLGGQKKTCHPRLSSRTPGTRGSPPGLPAALADAACALVFRRGEAFAQYFRRLSRVSRSAGARRKAAPSAFREGAERELLPAASLPAGYNAGDTPPKQKAGCPSRSPRGAGAEHWVCPR